MVKIQLFNPIMKNQEKIIACQFDDSVELFLKKQHKSLFFKLKEFIRRTS